MTARWLPFGKFRPLIRTLAVKIGVKVDRVITALSDTPFVRVSARTVSALLGFVILAQSVNLLLTDMEPLRQIYTNSVDHCRDQNLSDFRILQVAFCIVFPVGYFVLAFYPTNRPEWRAVTWFSTEIGLLSAPAASVVDLLIRLNLDWLLIRGNCDLRPIYESIALTVNPIFFFCVLLILSILLWHSRRADRRSQKQHQGYKNG
ncbi:MAG: hypothetical protein AB7G39_00140 [Alphaproteobacteria bacterium]